MTDISEIFRETLNRMIEKLKKKEKVRELRSLDVLMYSLTSKLDLITKQQVVNWCQFRLKNKDNIVPGDPNLPSKYTYLL